MKAICNSFPKTMLFLGPSGSGKDTQAEKLADMCGYEVIGTGEMFRDEEIRSTEIGQKAFEYWGKGKWVPDDIVYELFTEWLKKYDPSKPWIFSQVVRTVPQIKLLDDLLLKNFNRKIDKVVYFSLSSDAAIERMSLRRYCPKCGRDYHLKYKKPKNGDVCDDDGSKLITRDDDHPEAILSRLNEFETKVKPVLEEYKKRGLLMEVDAAPSIDEIHEFLIRALENV